MWLLYLILENVILENNNNINNKLLICVLILFKLPKLVHYL